MLCCSSPASPFMVLIAKALALLPGSMVFRGGNYGAQKLLGKSSIRVCCCSIAARHMFTFALSQTDHFMGDLWCIPQSVECSTTPQDFENLFTRGLRFAATSIYTPR